MKKYTDEEDVLLQSTHVRFDNEGVNEYEKCRHFSDDIKEYDNIKHFNSEDELYSDDW